jgi:hypothetical protein
MHGPNSPLPRPTSLFSFPPRPAPFSRQPLPLPRRVPLARGALWPDARSHRCSDLRGHCSVSGARDRTCFTEAWGPTSQGLLLPPTGFCHPHASVVGIPKSRIRHPMDATLSLRVLLNRWAPVSTSPPWKRTPAPLVDPLEAATKIRIRRREPRI